MPATKPSNLVLLFDDQHRAQDLGVAGNAQVKTPNLDKLAAEGLYLPNTFSGCPVCCPARAVLMTGKYPHKAGLRINDQRILLNQPALATELNAAGYTTAFIGKWHLDGGIREPGFVPKERRLGYQWWAANQCRHAYFDTKYFRDAPGPLPMEQYEPLELTDLAIEFIEGHADRSFCLVVGYSPPHDPYLAPPEYMAMYPPEDIELRPNFVPGTRMGGRNSREVTAEHVAGYYAAITCIDDQVGRIMATLDKQGLADDTLFIFTSDHGDMLGSNGYILKRKPHEESIRVPGIFRWPAAIQPKQTKDAIFSWADIMPTLLSLCSAPIPAGVQGQDLSNVLLADDDGPESAYLQIYMPYPTKVDGGWRGVRTKRYTYARYEEQPWVLFDNEEDPYQRRNLAEDPGSASIRDELEGLVRHWMLRTGDSWEYNVPRTLPLHLNPVEEHEEMIAAVYREAGRHMPRPGLPATSLASETHRSTKSS